MSINVKIRGPPIDSVVKFIVNIYMKEQLEVYKIIVKGDNDTFRSLITDKFGRTRSKKESDIFLHLFKHFIADIDKRVWKVDDSLQAITILKQNKTDNVNRIVTPHSANFVIEGYIDGGHYDMLRTLTDLNNTSNPTKITRDKMVSDRYYFCLYIKPDTKIGLLLIEKKGTLSISRIICKYIEHLLKVTNARKCKTVRFIPQYLIDEFRQGAIVDNITCTDEFAKQVYSHDGIALRDSHYTVTVKITPNDEEDRQSDSNYLMQQLRNIKIKFFADNQEKPLIDFTNKRGTLKQENGKSCSFDLDGEETIRPVIEIPDELLTEEKDVLKRMETENFCNEILQQLKNEVYAV